MRVADAMARGDLVEASSPSIPACTQAFTPPAAEAQLPRKLARIGIGSDRSAMRRNSTRRSRKGLSTKPLNRYAPGGWMPLQRNPDGSLRLRAPARVARQGPGGERLPAPAGEFNLTLRVNLPTEDDPAVLKGSCKPPGVTVARQPRSGTAGLRVRAFCGRWRRRLQPVREFKAAIR